jgi:CubicO group peptidase (beta-lactamase class C family)
MSPIGGFCDPAFLAVREAFELNLSSEHEIGACAALVIDGKTVVDLWGGWRDAARAQVWERDTLVCMMSVTKSVGALCVLLLADRGRVDLDAPVAKYWPGFALNGKAAITVRRVLAQLASLPYLDTLGPGELWDFDKVAAAIEAQAPEWPPGTKPCYHSFTAGHLYQQIVRCVDGRSLGRFLREEINEPFGIDYRIGLTADEDARRAQYIVTPGTPSWEGIMGRRESPLNRAWKSLERDEDVNSHNWRFKEFPSGNGHATARATAQLFAGLASGGIVNGWRLMRAATIADATREQWNAVEAMTNRHFRYGTGFMLSCPPFPVGGNPRNFGHPGVGGATGFGDPDRRLGFCYAGNHMAPVADAGPYATRLVDAVYNCL